MKQRRILVVDDEPGIRQSLSGVLEDEGYAVDAVESGEACLAALPGAVLRSGAAGHLAAGHGRHGGAGAHSGDSLRRTAGGGDDFRPRHHRDGGEGHQAGRFRFSGEAALHRESHGGGEERAGAPQPGAREQPPEGGHRARASASSAKRAHEGAAAAARADGRHQRARADLRRERHGQGTGGARAARAEPAGREAVRGSELRGDSRGADRERAVRAHQGQLHGRARGQDRQIPEGRWRHAVPGRSGRYEPAHAGQGAARAGGAALRAGGRGGIDAGGRARGGGHQQEPGRRDRARQFPRGPVLPAERDSVFRAAAARPARGYSAAGGSFPARIHHGLRPQAQGTDAGGVPACWPSITGRATCAS